MAGTYRAYRGVSHLESQEESADSFQHILEKLLLLRHWKHRLVWDTENAGNQLRGRVKDRIWGSRQHFQERGVCAKCRGGGQDRASKLGKGSVEGHPQWEFRT